MNKAVMLLFAHIMTTDFNYFFFIPFQLPDNILKHIFFSRYIFILDIQFFHTGTLWKHHMVVIEENAINVRVISDLYRQGQQKNSQRGDFLKGLCLLWPKVCLRWVVCNTAWFFLLHPLHLPFWKSHKSLWFITEGCWLFLLFAFVLRWNNLCIWHHPVLRLRLGDMKLREK